MVVCLFDCLCVGLFVGWCVGSRDCFVCLLAYSFACMCMPVRLLCYVLYLFVSVCLSVKLFVRLRVCVCLYVCLFHGLLVCVLVCFWFASLVVCLFDCAC